MTDGAARTLDLYGDHALRERILPHLLSRDPAEFWTVGQWMTERAAGSDIGRTETVAKRHGGPGEYRLHGAKSCTSATVSPVAMTLARLEGAPMGIAGVSLFCAEVYDEIGGLRGIRIERMLDKLGSRALPTADLELDGTTAFLVGDKSHGERRMSALFDLTRIHHSVYAASYMRRALALARDYAAKREAHGRPLSESALHIDTLSALQVEADGCFHLAFHLTVLLGRRESGSAAEGEDTLLRLLAPVAKLFTAKRAVDVVSEAAEAFGGVGYLEDTGIPALLRNTLALPVWEGTTNVLALDVLRAMEKDGAFEPYAEDVLARLRRVKDEPLAESVRRVRKAL
jgi:alkylation response protein AidB-like acyl-CoA dehydrogenase